jgi:hypothetical protein
MSHSSNQSLISDLIVVVFFASWIYILIIDHDAVEVRNCVIVPPSIVQSSENCL